MALTSIQKILGNQDNENYRHKIEHAVMLQDDQIQLMMDEGIVASIQLLWFAFDRTGYFDRSRIRLGSLGCSVEGSS